MASPQAALRAWPQCSGEGVLLHAEIQETGLCHGDALRLGQQGLQPGGQGLGDGERRLVQGAGQLHGRAAGIVAKLGVLGGVDGEYVLLRVQVKGVLHGLADSLGDLLIKIHGESSTVYKSNHGILP